MMRSVPLAANSSTPFPPSPEPASRMTAPAGRSPAWGIVLCSVSALCFGILGLLSLSIGRLGTDRATMITWRFVIAAVILWGLVVALKRPLGKGRALWQPLVMGGVFYALENAFYFRAVEQIGAGVAALLLYTMPLFVVAVQLLRGTQQLSTRLLLAVTLAVGGIAATMAGPGARFDLLGFWFGIGSAITYTFYYLGMDTLPAHTDRLSASALVCTGSATSAPLLGVIDGGFQGLPSASAWPQIATMAVVCTVAAIGLLMIGIQYAGPAVASVVSCLEPIAAVLLGAAFLAEPFGPAQWLGTLGVVVAVLLLSAPSHRRAARVEA